MSAASTCRFSSTVAPSMAANRESVSGSDIDEALLFQLPLKRQQASFTWMSRPAQDGITKAGLVGGIALLAVIVFVVVSSLQLEAYSCEVCMRYKGRTQCRTVGGATLQEARTAAIANACAFISSGVTDSLACTRLEPVSENCR